MRRMLTLIRVGGKRKLRAPALTIIDDGGDLGGIYTGQSNEVQELTRRFKHVYRRLP